MSTAEGPEDMSEIDKSATEQQQQQQDNKIIMMLLLQQIQLKIHIHQVLPGLLLKHPMDYQAVLSSLEYKILQQLPT